MAYDLEHACPQHPDRFQCPDALIAENSRGYGLIIHDGGSSMIQISFCPWCGAKLPMRRPDLALDGWQLEDGERYAREHPTNFRLADIQIRRALQPGDFAKLIFRVQTEDDRPQIERMWVIVRERVEDGYIGVLDNEPTLISKNAVLWRGSELAFGPQHIVDVGHGTPESLAEIARPPSIPWPGG